MLIGCLLVVVRVQEARKKRKQEKEAWQKQQLEEVSSKLVTVHMLMLIR